LEWLPIELKLGKAKKERSRPMKNVIRIGSKRKPKVTPQEMTLASTLDRNTVKGYKKLWKLREALRREPALLREAACAMGPLQDFVTV
jgi:hypothetical protein